jgi:hypothetical protein
MSKKDGRQVLCIIARENHQISLLVVDSNNVDNITCNGMDQKKI